MDLTEEVIQGLSYLSNDAIINDDNIKQILAECVNILTNSNKQISKYLLNIIYFLLYFY